MLIRHGKKYEVILLLTSVRYVRLCYVVAGNATLQPVGHKRIGRYTAGAGKQVRSSFYFIFLKMTEVACKLLNVLCRISLTLMN